MTYRKNVPSGQTTGTTATTGNTGGSSGDAASAFPGTAAPTFDSTSPPSGRSLAYKCAAVSGSSIIWQWNGLSGTDAAVDFLFMYTATPAATTEIIHIRSAGAAMGRLLFTTANKLQINNNANSSLFVTTAALTANTWYRVSYRIKPGTGTGDGQVSFSYALWSTPTTAIQTYSSTTVDSGTATITDTRFGKLTSTTWASNFFLSDLQVTDAAAGALLSPLSLTPVTNAGPDQSGIDPYQTVTLDGTASSNTPTSYAWTQTAGTTVTLSSSTASQPTFTPPKSFSAQTLTFSLVATNGSGGGTTDTVDIAILPCTDGRVTGSATANPGRVTRVP